MAFFEELEVLDTKGKEEKGNGKKSREKPLLSDVEKRRLAGEEKRAAKKERIKIRKADRERVVEIEPAVTVEPLSKEEQVSRAIAKLDQETLKSLARIVESYRTQQDTVRQNHRGRKTTYDEHTEEMSELEAQTRAMIAMRLFDGGDLIDPKNALVTSILRGEGLPHSEVAPKRKLSVVEEAQENFEKQLEVPMEWARPRWEDLNLPPQAMYMIQQLIQQCRYAQYDLFEKHEAEGRGDPMKAIRSEAFEEVREGYGKKILKIIRRFNTIKKNNVNYQLIPSGFYRMLMGMEPRPENDPHRNDQERHPAAEAVREPVRPSASNRPKVGPEAEEAYTGAFEEEALKRGADGATKKGEAPPQKPPSPPEAPGGAPEEEKNPLYKEGDMVVSKDEQGVLSQPLRVVAVKFYDGDYQYAVAGTVGRIPQSRLQKWIDTGEKAPAATVSEAAKEEARSPQEQADQGREAAELAQQLKVALDALWQQATKGMEAPAGVRFEDVGSKVSARLEQLCREQPDKAKALLGAAKHLEYMPQRQQELEREIMERSLTREIARRREAAARARAKKEEAAPRNPFSRAFWVKVGESLFGRGARQRSAQSERLARKLADVEVFTKDMETTVEKAEIYKKTVHAMREQILLQFAQEFPALKETFEKAKAAAQEKIRTHIALSAADEETPEGTKRVSVAALEQERKQLHAAQEHIAELGTRGGLVDFTSDIPVKEGEKERALNTPELKLHTDYLIAGVVGTELERSIEGLKLKNENDPEAAYTNLKTTIEEFLKRPMGGKTADKVEKFFRNVLRRKIEDPETDQITRHMLERLFKEKKWPLQKAT